MGTRRRIYYSSSVRCGCRAEASRTNSIMRVCFDSRLRGTIYFRRTAIYFAAFIDNEAYIKWEDHFTMCSLLGGISNKLKILSALTEKA